MPETPDDFITPDDLRRDAFAEAKDVAARPDLVHAYAFGRVMGEYRAIYAAFVAMCAKHRTPDPQCGTEADPFYAEQI